MTKCLQKLPCSGCGSHDSLQPFLNEDGTVTAFCFGKCQKLVPNPFGDKVPDLSKIKVKTAEEIQEEIEEIKSCPNVPFYRSIKADLWAKYRVKASVNQITGKGMYAIHHPHTRDGKLISYMTKTVAKKAIWCVGNINEADLYAWEIAKRSGARTLYVTEGQEDCIAVDQILITGDGEKYKQNNAVVSLPNGTKSVAVLGRQAAEIAALFEDVVLVFDNDDAGKKAIREALRYIPSAHVVSLPSKDANQVLVDGLVDAAYKALKFRKAKAAPTGLTKFKDVKGKLNETAKMGIALPWDNATEWLRGLHPGLYTVAGGEGLGKTSLVHQMASKNAQDGLGVIAVMLEESQEESFLNIGNKILGRDTTKPTDPIKPEEEDILEENFEKLFVYNVEEDRSATAEELKDNILFLAREILDDWDVLYVDNLTKISESITSSAEKNEFISSFAAEMDTFARRNNKVIVVLSHFNKQPKTETPYAEGGRGNSNQLAGGAGLARYSNAIIYVERNTQGEDPSAIKFRVGKNRKGKITGVIKMHYQKDTTCTIEADWEDSAFRTKK